MGVHEKPKQIKVKIELSRTKMSTFVVCFDFGTSSIERCLVTKIKSYLESSPFCSIDILKIYKFNTSSLEQ